jgi:hypothetical protein
MSDSSFQQPTAIRVSAVPGRERAMMPTSSSLRTTTGAGMPSSSNATNGDGASTCETITLDTSGRQSRR